jgi:hypothetical protein
MAQDQMLEDHKRSWQSFCKLVTYSTVAIVISLALMALFLL